MEGPSARQHCGACHAACAPPPGTPHRPPRSPAPGPQALEQHAAALGIPRTLYMPKVTQPVLIEHRAERTAKVVGRLGEKAARQGQAVRGLLVQGRGGGRSLVHHEDLPRFTALHPGRVVQRQALALHRPFSEVRRSPAARGGRMAGGAAARLRLGQGGGAGCCGAAARPLRCEPAWPA